MRTTLSGIIVLALLLLAPGADAAEKGPRGKQLLTWQTTARATNGYRFEFLAVRAESEGSSAIISVRNDSATATYVLRRPAQITRRRVVADFGALGSVRLRRDESDFEDRGKTRCGRFSFNFGELRGGIRFDGESGFTTVRESQPFGAIVNQRIRRECESIGPGLVPFAAPADEGAILGSCGPGAGVSLVALELMGGAETEFLASKVEIGDRLEIYRSVSVEGTSGNFATANDEKTGRLRPPEPFVGRGFFESGELRGNLRVTLPGAGLVSLTPGDARLTGFEDFVPPKCLPPPLPTAEGGLFSRAGSAAAARLSGFVLTGTIRDAIARFARR